MGDKIGKRQGARAPPLLRATGALPPSNRILYCSEPGAAKGFRHPMASCTPFCTCEFKLLCHHLHLPAAWSRMMLEMDGHVKNWPWSRSGTTTVRSSGILAQLV